jgi:DNA replication and repair protein RecF
MKVTELRVRHFRNLTDSVIYPRPHLNFLIGSNGQGKTSWLEALCYLATLRSFRDRKVAHVIEWGYLASEISCNLVLSSGHTGELQPAYTLQDGTGHLRQDSWSTDLKIHFKWVDPAKNKAIKSAFINEKAYKSSTQYLTQRFGSVEMGFHTIIFNPADHDLVRGEPAIRRSYLDQVIAAQDVEYLKNLQKYNRSLSQRNALLKRDGPYTSLDLISGFTDQMCAFGSELANARLRWIKQVNPLVQDILAKIAPEQSPVQMIYCSSWIDDPNLRDLEKLAFKNKHLETVHFAGQGDPGSLELLKQSFRAKSSSLEAQERKLGYSLVGPHRDDWKFLLGDQALNGHGSQGEVRSALLALKLAELILFQKATGHRPLFLLDDFSSELDHRRRSFLLQFLSETDLQTFITTTDDSSLFGNKFWISKGKVKEGKQE